MKKIASNLMFIALFAILVYGLFGMPTESTVHAPSYNDVTRHYVEDGILETNASNLIAAILADYRGFDTLGETIVLFTSVVAVGSVLRSAKYDEKGESRE